MATETHAIQLRRVIEERDRTQTLLDALTATVDDIVESGDRTNTDDEHDPDGSTIGYEKAQMTALRDEARSTLAGLDRAVAEIRSGTYGRCESCGGTIAPARLDALPATRVCIDCAAGLDAGSDHPPASPGH